MLRFTLAALPIACALCAQEAAPPPAAVLKYAGAPMRVPVRCGQNDLSAFGLTCPAARPCPVYLELDAIEPAGSELFITGNLHADDATLSSILLASDDGGATWREPAGRIRGAGLDLVQFLDAETGWASGESLGAIPRDPFLLLTRDGGVTWENRPIFGETRAGAIDFFHFDSKTHGRVWIGRPLSGETGNRYEAYESQDGGQTWILVETSDKPFPKGSRPAPAGDYRLRADSATGAYRVERRAPAGWRAVASFLVRAGECREPEFAPLADPGETQP
jgi:hypothetical protein